MSPRNPYIVMPRDAVTKIASSNLSGGALVLRRVPADDMYVVQAVETGKDIRLPADVPREYAALRSASIRRGGRRAWMANAPVTRKNGVCEDAIPALDRSTRSASLPHP